MQRNHSSETTDAKQDEDTLKKELHRALELIRRLAGLRGRKHEIPVFEQRGIYHYEGFEVSKVENLSSLRLIKQHDKIIKIAKEKNLPAIQKLNQKLNTKIQESEKNNLPISEKIKKIWEEDGMSLLQTLANLKYQSEPDSELVLQLKKAINTNDFKQVDQFHENIITKIHSANKEDRVRRGIITRVAALNENGQLVTIEILKKDNPRLLRSRQSPFSHFKEHKNHVAALRKMKMDDHVKNASRGGKTTRLKK